MRILIFIFAGTSFALSGAGDTSGGDTDGEQSRKILGSSVVTSVSVIMDTGNGSKAVFTDAVGKPVPRPSSASELASPIDLLNPDRYEFYTFDDNGDLIKRLMSLEEIQGIIATGDSDGYDLDSFTSLGYIPEKRVNDVVNNVQNVLKEEMETHKNTPDTKPLFDTPDVSDSWSMILPAVFGNSGEDIKPEKPITHVTPDTIMIEPNMQNTYLSTADKLNAIVSSATKPIIHNVETTPTFSYGSSTARSTIQTQTSSKRPSVSTTSTQMSTPDKIVTLSTNIIPSLTPVVESEVTPLINVEIYSNSKSTETPLDQLETENAPTVEIRPSNTTTAILGSKFTTKKPLTTASMSMISFPPSASVETKSTSVIIENTTKLTPTTFMTSVPSSMTSTLPTTKTSSKIIDTTPIPPVTTEIKTQTLTSLPIFTPHTTDISISTWRPNASSLDTTESSIITETISVSTWKPKFTTEYTLSPIDDTAQENNLTTLPVLSNLNNDTYTMQYNQNGTSEIIVPSDFTTPSMVNVDQNEDASTTETVEETSESKLVENTQTTDNNRNQDLSTLGSEYFGVKINTSPTLQQTTLHFAETTTQLPLAQSMNSDQKVSATELLDQLLLSTNIYEINTELSKRGEQQPLSNEDERFDSTTVEKESVSSTTDQELKTTTEQFLIKVSENEQGPTDQTLIESIEQLLSQAVGDAGEALSNNTDTQKIQNMLNNSDSKNMSEILLESATIASDMIGANFTRNEEKTTTEGNMLEAVASDESSILSDSVGLLLSQVYESDPNHVTTIEQVAPTEKYPTTIFEATSISNNRRTEDTTLSMDPSTTDIYKLETTTYITNTVITDDNRETLEQETSTVADKVVIEDVTKNDQETDNYIALPPINSNDLNKDYVPHIINITIISSDTTKNNIKNRTKPAKSDVSLEQSLDEEIRKNMTEVESTQIYIEQTSTTTERSNEILKAEETMSALHKNTDIKINDQITTIRPEVSGLNDTSDAEASDAEASDVEASDAEEISGSLTASTKESILSTTESMIPSKPLTNNNEKHTTIIIIKRTEKPSIEESTTTDTIQEEEATNINTEASTVDEKLLDSTTLRQDIEMTEFVTEKMLPTTTEFFTEAIGADMTTEIKELEPSIDIIIDRDNNKPLSDMDKRIPVRNIDSTTSTDTNNTKTNIKDLNKDNDKPQATNNIDIKIPNEKHPQKENVGINSQQNEKVSDSTWTLVPTISPHTEVNKNYTKTEQHFPEIIEPPAPIDLVAKPLQGFGLEDSTSRLDTDIYQFAQLCNELAFGFWKTVTSGISSARSVFVSPFGATSLLAMVFLGARGATSGEMNEILKLDDMVTFNPHLIFKNVSESIRTDEPESGVASTAIIRELFSDRSKGKLLPFYKERARAFYDGYVEEASFREIGDVIRRRTNLQVKKYSNGKIIEFLKDSSVTARSPLAGVSVNIFHTDCSQASTEGRDGELHFVVLPSIRQRRLIPIPAIVYKSGFLAGYEPSLDATAISLGTKDQTVSTIFVIPGQQGIAAPGDGLARLEKRLVESSFKKGAWSRLLRSLIPRPGLEVQIPRFSHRSIINGTVALKNMGLHDLFDIEKADLRGLNGVVNEFFLSDMLQINSFATCGEKRIGEAHHSEIYPATASRARSARYLENYQNENTFYRSELLEEPRDYQRAFPDPLYDPVYFSLPLPLRPRQARVPETPRLRFDRPFIYFVRHNPTGLILHMGRFNPRLLP